MPASPATIPTVLRGRCAVAFGSNFFYTKDGVTVSRRKGTFDITTDSEGKIDTRLLNHRVEISFTPCGEIRGIAKYWPHGPSMLETVSIARPRQSILSGAVTIWAIDQGVTVAYNKAGITTPPPLILSPTKTAWGPMTITAIGNIAATSGLLDAAYIKTHATAAFSDTTFDEDKIYTDIYSAALGTRLAPYTAMGAREGFTITPEVQTFDVEDENVGIADIRLESIGYRVGFAPNNLTEAEVDALLMDQNSDAILPGQSIARGPSSVAENLVITGSHLVATVNAVGIVSAEHGFGVKRDRNGNIEFVQRMSFTSGAPTALITVTVA